MSTRENSGWKTTDPRGLRVVLTDAMVSRRDAMGKHPGKDRLEPEDAIDTVESPDYIIQSSSRPERQTYYSYEEKPGCPPFRRSTVVVGDFGDHDGEIISYSRYSKSTNGNIVWIKGRLT